MRSWEMVWPIMTTQAYATKDRWREQGWLEILQNALPERPKPLFKGGLGDFMGRWVPVKMINNIYPLTALMGCFRADSWPRWNQVEAGYPDKFLDFGSN